MVQQSHDILAVPVLLSQVGQESRTISNLGTEATAQGWHGAVKVIEIRSRKSSWNPMPEPMLESKPGPNPVPPSHCPYL
jgi:hypothetical protein